jgi:seryl-tRNA synthetase
METDTSFRNQLFAAGLLIRTGVDGLYGRSGTFEQVVSGLESLIKRLGASDGAEVMRFPPGLSRTEFERSGYLKGFPHLAGSIHCFCGDERGHREILRCVEAGEDWTGSQQASEIVLTPAACYPIYPVLAARGPLGDDGALVDVGGYCFRHEPSIEPTRQQMFRMQEYVRLGRPDQVLAFRQTWLDRAQEAVHQLGMPHEVDIANDPFFGRGGRVLASSQREQELKFELLIQVNQDTGPTACISFNYHLDHFAQVWKLQLADGSDAHSGCIGFGMDRLTLALFRHHGLQPDAWPAPVKAMLWP